MVHFLLILCDPGRGFFISFLALQHQDEKLSFCFLPPPKLGKGSFSEFQKSDFRFGFRRSKNYLVPNSIKIC